jgi:hypothetical protein
MTLARPTDGGRRPEIELLARCARVVSDPAAVRGALRPDLDWPDLVRAAHAHRVTPLVYRSLAACPEAVPPAALNPLREAYHATARRNLALAGELVQLLTALDARGVRAIPYKGPALAATAHGNLALRQFDDLDLLVRDGDVPAARAVLEARGYRRTVALPAAYEARYLRSVGELPFVRDRDRLFVELHTALAPRPLPLGLDWDRLWARLVPAAVGGTRVRTLCPEDHLLVLSVHGAKHLWACLGWVCDVAELVRAHADLNWGQVTAEAGRLGCRRMLLVGLALADGLLQAPVPEEVRRRVRSDPVAGSLAAQVGRNLLRGVAPGPVQHALFHLRASDRPWDGARYSLGFAFRPTAAEWTELPLPAALAPAHYLLRPVRLAAKYARRALGHRAG